MTTTYGRKSNKKQSENNAFGQNVCLVCKLLTWQCMNFQKTIYTYIYIYIYTIVGPTRALMMPFHPAFDTPERCINIAAALLLNAATTCLLGLPQSDIHHP